MGKTDYHQGSQVIYSIYGITLCVLIGGVSLFLSEFVPIGAITIAIILGVVIGNSVSVNEKVVRGITYCEEHLLAYAIGLMGLNLNFLILKLLGVTSIFIIIMIIMLTILMTILIGRLFVADPKTVLLIGIGNGICGSSAIAATKQIIRANKETVGVSIAIINFLGTIGIFLLPFIGGLVLKFADIDVGLLIGTTLQAVGQVVAAGFSMSNDAGQTATIVKMARILMLAPTLLLFMFIYKNKPSSSAATSTLSTESTFPLFILGFIVCSFISTFDIFSKEVISIGSALSHYGLIIAMAGIGLKISFKTIIKTQKRALLIGSLSFLIQIIMSVSLIVFVFR